MSIKEIKEKYLEGKAFFGIRETLKKYKKKKKVKIFVSKDAREETIKKLKENGINFEFTKKKEEVAKELGLNFQSEVYLLE
ncbi:MAG: ribosomal L7Ae/L30e/S12e/Gadd45 family protein [Candidatus Pacearchaeota archaeon]